MSQELNELIIELGKIVDGNQSIVSELDKLKSLYEKLKLEVAENLEYPFEEREHDKRALLTRFRQFRDKCNGDWKQKREDCIGFNGYHIEAYNGTGDMKLRSDWNPVCERFCLFGYFQKQVDCDRAIELFGDEIKRLFVEVE